MNLVAKGKYSVPAPDGAGGTAIQKLETNTAIAAAVIEFSAPANNAGDVFIGTNALNKSTGAGVFRVMIANTASAPERIDGGSDGNQLGVSQYGMDAAEVLAGTKAVTGAVTSSGLIRLTVTGHGYTTGDIVRCALVGGVPNAAGLWTITVIDANTIDLAGSTFAGTYTSGGTTAKLTQSAVYAAYWTR